MVRHARPFALAVAASLALVAAPDTASAQFGKRLKDAVKHNAENRAIQEVVQQENKAIDAALTADLSSGDDAAGGALHEELSTSGRVTAEGVGFEPGTATMTEGSAPALKVSSVECRGASQRITSVSVPSASHESGAARTAATVSSSAGAEVISPSAGSAPKPK